MSAVQVLRAARVVTDQVYVDGWVAVRDGVIAEVGAGRAPDADVVDLGEVSLLPGLVDVHVHGGGGAGFGADVEATQRALAYHAQGGTTALLATLVSNPLDVIEAQLAAVAQADSGSPRLIGVHLEGPFISVERRGAHNPAYLCAPTESDVRRVLDVVPGLVRAVTAAPELGGFDGLVRAVDAAGAYVSAGHTDAGGDVLVAAAASAGVRALTHVFNGMRPLHHREPGPLQALTDTSLFCELICDGEHLHPATVRAIRSVVGPERVVLVTDAVPWAGLPDGAYAGGIVEVRDGAVRLAGTDTLAGSALTMAEALRRYATYTGSGLPELALVAATNPAALAGESGRLGRIAPGYAADFTVLDAELRCVATMVAGRWVHGAVASGG